MPLIRVDLSQVPEPTPAQQIIDSMVKLKWLRYHKQVSRAEFLKRWSKLRYLLSYTVEYKRWRSKVFARFPKCKCGQPSAEAHHKVRVVDTPQLALDDRNGIGICKKCHEQTHPPRSPRATAPHPHTTSARPSPPSTQARGSR